MARVISVPMAIWLWVATGRFVFKYAHLIIPCTGPRSSCSRRFKWYLKEKSDKWANAEHLPICHFSPSNRGSIYGCQMALLHFSRKVQQSHLTTVTLQENV